MVCSLALAIGMGHTACDQDESLQRERAELGRLSRLVQRLRRAPNADKAPALSALQQFECRLPSACRLQRTCVEAYRIHQEALQGVAAARHRLRGDAAPDGAQSTVELLQLSQERLQEAREAMRRCTDLQGELSRAHRL